MARLAGATTVALTGNPAGPLNGVADKLFENRRAAAAG